MSIRSVLHLITSTLLVPLALAQSGQAVAPSPAPPFQPITGKQRLNWAITYTAGPRSLAAGTVSAGWGTLFNTPREYGTHWEGFGDRYGMRLTGVATSNVMEAGLGAIWGEDPRYRRAAGESFGNRFGNVFKMAFLAQNKEGRTMPAFARYAAITGSNYLSNTWRADSEATLSRATVRVGLGFLGRIAANAWDEFWPDVSQQIFHRPDRDHASLPASH